MATFSEQAKRRYLAELRATVNRTRAAEAAGVSVSTVKKHLESDPLFAEREREALEEGVDLLEDNAHVRAFKGVEKGVWHKGAQVGTEVVYSDALTMFLLKAHRPDKYRERSQVDQNVQGGLSLVVETGVPREPPAGVDDLL